MQTQEETAEWMGYPSVEAMNIEHDDLHRKLCAWLGLPSYSLLIAEGHQVSHEQATLAAYEEDAVLNLQRFIQHSRIGIDHA
jgi:hypothetical protein